MKTIQISMTDLHHNLAHYIELAKQGDVVEVVNRLRGRVECHIIAPTLTYDMSDETLSATDVEMSDEPENTGA